MCNRTVIHSKQKRIVVVIWCLSLLATWSAATAATGRRALLIAPKTGRSRRAQRVRRYLRATILPACARGTAWLPISGRASCWCDTRTIPPVMHTVSGKQMGRFSATIVRAESSDSGPGSRTDADRGFDGLGDRTVPSSTDGRAKRRIHRAGKREVHSPLKSGDAFTPQANVCSQPPGINTPAPRAARKHSGIRRTGAGLSILQHGFTGTTR